MDNARRQKVLTAEDEPTIRELIARILTDEGYEVHTASDGAEAIEKAQSEKPDLILLDINMPKLDGIEACKKIRATESLAPTRIIILTAYNTRDRLEESIAAGADDFLGKPIDSLELKVRVRSILKVKDISDQVERLLAYVQSMNKERGKPLN
jgi:CheY-like chemotaxis protein